MVEYTSNTIAEKMFIPNGVIAIDTDLQGVWETGDLLFIKNTFPLVYKVYQGACLNAIGKVGTCMLINEGGQKVILMFTKLNRHDGKPVAIRNFESCVKCLLNLLPPTDLIYSPVVGRKDKALSDMVLVINRVTRKENEALPPRKWYICRKAL